MKILGYIVSFLCPIVGIIIYFVAKDKAFAAMCLKLALIAIVIGLVVKFII